MDIVKHILDKNIISRDDRVLVGVSGGVDSVVLLHALLHCGYNCIVAHCNFHLRGDESDRDASHVKHMADQYGVDMRIVDFETERYAERKGISIEMAARELRYEWFEKIRKEENCKYVVVAHNADDSIETCFLNIIRGTGIRGLTGISEIRGNVIRPLLEVSRSEILEYARNNNLEWCEDSSNIQTIYKRNKIRHDIIPQLREINPSFDKTMLSNMCYWSNVYEIYEQYANDAYNECCSERGGIFYINIKKLRNKCGVNALLYEWLSHKFSFTSSTVFLIIQSLDKISGKIFYSNKYKAIKDRDYIIIAPLNNQSSNINVLVNKWMKEINNPINLRFEYIIRSEGYKIPKSKNIAALDLDKLSFPLEIRKWRQGDVMYPFGMIGKKKISDIFTDNKLSIIEKEQKWILLSAGQVVWILGMRIDRRFAIDERTTHILHIIM